MSNAYWNRALKPQALNRAAKCSKVEIPALTKKPQPTERTDKNDKS